MKIENTRVTTPDGFDLSVEIRTPEGEAKKTIVMSHGATVPRAGKNGSLIVLADALCNAGYRVVQYDFRGHGESSGKDLDVCLSGLRTDLETIIENFAGDDYYLFGFSFGGLTTCNYLYTHKNTTVKKVVLIGPPLDPINSSLLNPKEFCQPEIQAAIDDGSLEKNGYAYWSSKDFRVAKKWLDECYAFDYKEAIKCLVGRTLLLQGKEDRNVDWEYNHRFAEEYGLEYKEYEGASHSLWEIMDEVAKVIIEYYER